jgi:hypothetical protein
MRGGQRDAPGALGKLTREQFRRHRRLAMRCQLHAVCAHEIAHPLQVVRQTVFIEHCRRETELFGQQTPARLTRLGRRERRVQTPHRLVQRIDHTGLVLCFTHD